MTTPAPDKPPPRIVGTPNFDRLMKVLARIAAKREKEQTKQTPAA